MEHVWQSHSVTEVNGAGVQREEWETCINCGQIQDQWSAPETDICLGKDGMTVEAFANYACEKLPEGWQLSLTMEKGSGDFELTSPTGFVHSEEFCSVDDPLVKRGVLAVTFAIRDEAANG
jgi:hypothetical protein